MSGDKILVVEDEASIRKFITINLERSGFTVFTAESGEKALELADRHKPAVMVLDIMLPGIDGLEVCRRVRRDMPELIVIMLTAKSQDIDKIAGLELGADDYMVKPFNPRELVARINTILRRIENKRTNPAEIYRFKNLVLNIPAQKFLKNDTEVELTPTEFSVLKELISNPGKAMSRNELLNAVWGRNYFGDLKTLDVYVRRLREKIEDNPSDPCFIETVWGYGYRWQDGELS
ncbi:MAG: response regulator transcription factor [Clostridiales bacterium]|nr:response regulator transcription factor [Clostridiales bacterium]